MAGNPHAAPSPRPDTVPDASCRWNYALDVSGETPEADITVERQPMPAKWNWPLDSPLKLHALARSFDWQPVTRKALPAEPVAGRTASETITLVPYGCAKFRVAMFPLTERAFKLLELRKPVPSPRP